MGGMRVGSLRQMTERIFHFERLISAYANGYLKLHSSNPVRFNRPYSIALRLEIHNISLLTPNPLKLPSHPPSPLTHIRFHSRASKDTHDSLNLSIPLISLSFLLPSQSFNLHSSKSLLRPWSKRNLNHSISSSLQRYIA